MFPALRDPGWDGNSMSPPDTEAPAVPSQGEMLDGQLPSPCQPSCKGIRVVCEFLWDVGSDFQTPGVPCRRGEQHVLVPQVTEEPHLDNLM